MLCAIQQLQNSLVRVALWLCVVEPALRAIPLALAGEPLWKNIVELAS
jgi:hypothetical protein